MLFERTKGFILVDGCTGQLKQCESIGKFSLKGRDICIKDN